MVRYHTATTRRPTVTVSFYSWKLALFLEASIGSTAVDCAVCGCFACRRTIIQGAYLVIVTILIQLLACQRVYEHACFLPPAHIAALDGETKPLLMSHPRPEHQQVQRTIGC